VNPWLRTDGRIYPGTAIGVLGSGQLGRMFAMAARRMGYRVHTYSPESDTPTGQVSDVEITAPYEDLDKVRAFARNVSAVTFEFENVPADTAAACAECARVRPAGEVLHTTQHRLREKNFLKSAGLPHTPFAAVRSLADLHAALQSLGTPAILKTAGFGYDGKGQVLIQSPDAAEAAWLSLNTCEAVLEAFVDFECEVSVVAARGMDGDFRHYGAVENSHCNRILDISLAPASVSPAIAKEAVDIARTVLEQLNVVGVLCVEFFVAKNGKLLINELAPRPHNSGHFSFDACLTSQFEQQLRAVCGLPLGATDLLRPAAMANLLGDLWANGEPNWQRALQTPEIKLHLYGKFSPRKGRKMGHLTALHPDPETAWKLVSDARAALTVCET
jgi:5-(carboxyamino)imidazole ribonucleotide synthase